MTVEALARPATPELDVRDGLVAQGLVRYYGQVPRGHGHDACRCGVASRRPARPERSRQDDDVLHDRRTAAAATKGASCSMARTSPHEPVYRRARLGIGYLAQEPSIFRRLTVRENVLAVLETMKLTPQRARGPLGELLDDLNLTHLADRQAHNLSGGERRRVEITRALAREPSFMLLDEPFVGIDPIAVAEIQDIVRRLRDRGLGVLITDHNVRETLQHHRPRVHHVRGTHPAAGDGRAAGRETRRARAIYLGERFPSDVRIPITMEMKHSLNLSMKSGAHHDAAPAAGAQAPPGADARTAADPEAGDHAEPAARGGRRGRRERGSTSARRTSPDDGGERGSRGSRTRRTRSTGPTTCRTARSIAPMFPQSEQLGGVPRKGAGRRGPRCRDRLREQLHFLSLPPRHDGARGVPGGLARRSRLARRPRSRTSPRPLAAAARGGRGGADASSRRSSPRAWGRATCASAC